MSNRNVELNRANNDLINLQNSAKLAVVLVGRDLTIRRFSPQAEKLLDLLAADVGRSIGQVRHTLVFSEAGVDPLVDLEDLCSEVVASVRERERQVRDKRGCWYALRVRPYLTFDNKVEGAVLVLMDIDTLKRSEQETKSKEATLQQINAQLRDSERRFRAMIYALPAAVYTTDAEGRLIHFNPVAASLSGTPPLGTDQWHLSWKLYRADGTPLPHDEYPMTMALKELRDVQGEQIILERPDKVRRWLEPYATLLRDEQGQVVGGINMLMDVTERRKAEETQALLAEIVASSDDAILSEDLNSIITTWNKGARGIFGYTAEEVIGKPVTMLSPPDRLEEAPRILERIRRGETIVHYETVRQRKDGSLLNVSLTVSPIRDASGRIIGAAKIARDITERNRVEEQLHQSAAKLAESDRRKSEFLAILAHELRNPLAPLSHGLQILRLSSGNPQTVKSMTDLMKRQVDHLVGLVDDLLDMNRISQGKIELHRAKIELASVVTDAVDIARPLSERRKHELTVTLPTEPICVYADPLRLAQVIRNLLNNACKFTEQGGRIRLNVERAGEQAVIRVLDNGIGIAPDQLPLVFDLFMQGDVSMERSFSGLGIGLALVKTLVEMHDGTVEAHSAGVGGGSEFVVRLPIVFEASVLQPTKPPVDEPIMAPRRILVVDDNRDGAELLAMLLKMTGHETHIAHDGLEAVEMASQIRPDLILLDIGLPKMDGYEVARRIRAEPWGKKLVLVALTGWGQEEDRRKSQKAGFDSHIVKPVDPDALTGVLTQLSPTR